MVAKISVMARMAIQSTGGVFERYLKDRRASITLPTMADATPQ
jgi:hypothetical protein